MGIETENLELARLFASKIGPLLFRLAWWNHLDPAKRPFFARDFTDAVVVAAMKSYEAESGQVFPRAQFGSYKPVVALLLDGLLRKVVSAGLEELVPKYENETFEKVVERVSTNRNESELNRQLSGQYELFQKRIANLSDEMISAVKSISEEYMIWIRTHTDAIPKIAWEALEKITGEILSGKGMRVALTGRSRGQNGDVIAIETSKDGREIKYLIECKRYGEKIGMEIVNNVIGAKTFHDIERAMLVTTSTFTRDVINSKPRLAELRLELKDGKDIVEWLNNYNFHEDLGLWLEPDWEA